MFGEVGETGVKVLMSTVLKIFAFDVFESHTFIVYRFSDISMQMQFKTLNYDCGMFPFFRFRVVFRRKASTETEEPSTDIDISIYIAF